MNSATFNDCTPVLIELVNLPIIEFVLAVCATFLNAESTLDRTSFDESDCAADLTSERIRSADMFSANDCTSPLAIRLVLETS